MRENEARYGHHLTKYYYFCSHFSRKCNIATILNTVLYLIFDMVEPYDIVQLEKLAFIKLLVILDVNFSQITQFYMIVR